MVKNQNKMSIAKKIYFSPLGYVISLLQHLMSPFCQRIMVYGFYNKKRRKFYKSTRISSSAYITDIGNLDVGDNVWVNHNARIDASGGVKIGEGCQIGYGAMILSHSSHQAIRLNGRDFIKMDISERLGYIHKPVEIGDYTFIGGGAAVLPGVKIGKGCVVGVNSVVTKNIPDYAIVAGVPAHIIGSTIDTDKPFFDNETVKEKYYEQTLVGRKGLVDD